LQLEAVKLIPQKMHQPSLREDVLEPTVLIHYPDNVTSCCKGDSNLEKRGVRREGGEGPRASNPSDILFRHHRGRGTGLGGAAALAVRAVVESADERAAIAKVQRSDDPAQGKRLRASTSRGLVRGISTRSWKDPPTRERGKTLLEVCSFPTKTIACGLALILFEPGSNLLGERHAHPGFERRATFAASGCCVLGIFWK